MRGTPPRQKHRTTVSMLKFWPGLRVKSRSPNWRTVRSALLGGAREGELERGTVGPKNHSSQGRGNTTGLWGSDAHASDLIGVRLSSTASALPICAPQSVLRSGWTGGMSPGCPARWVRVALELRCFSKATVLGQIRHSGGPKWTTYCRMARLMERRCALSSPAGFLASSSGGYDVPERGHLSNGLLIDLTLSVPENRWRFVHGEPDRRESRVSKLQSRPGICLLGDAKNLK
jgi:hypothetical protein